jgi:two-component system heavy metal sensor histidine kinase CusS
VVQVACDRRRETEILGRYRAYSWSMLGIAFLACAAISYVLAHRGIRPVHEIAAAARQVHAETLDKRLRTEDLPAELRTLAETFNEMLDRLSDSFKRLSQFSADIAHELRTPVNNLRGELEVALGKTRSPQEYEEVLFSTLEECERLSRLVDQLLFIARAEHTESTAEFQRVNVAHELSAVGGFYDAVAGEGGVRLTTVCAPGLEADLNSELFRCAVGNLVANAIAHTPPSGEVSISVAIADGALHVNVSDTGCGIAPEEMARVFDRFYRADRARGNKGGFGLGLSIVRSIAQLHRGSVELSSPPGQGTRVTIRFPLRHTAGGAAAGA